MIKIKTILSLFGLLLMGTSAFARSQTFVLDVSDLPKDEQDFVKNYCTYLYTLDSSQDLAKFIVNKEYSILKSSRLIEQNDSVWEGAPDPSNPYSGRTLLRVFLLELPARETYPQGIFLRVALEQYGVGESRRGFKLSTELINRRGSAEFVEDSVCFNLKYRLRTSN